MPKATEPLSDRQARYDRIKRLRDAEGKTLEDIAQAEHLTRQRVAAILSKPRPERQYGGRPRAGQKVNANLAKWQRRVARQRKAGRNTTFAEAQVTRLSG